MSDLETEVIKAGLKKNRYFREVLENTIKALKYFEMNHILTTQEMNEYMTAIENISDMIHTCNEIVHDNGKFVACLQDINNSLFCIIKQCGTYNLSDLLHICFGHDYEKELNINTNNVDRFKMLLKYVQPIKFNNYGKLSKKTLTEEDGDIVKNSENLSCFSMNHSDIFECKVSGIRIVFQTKKHHTIVVYGMVENIILQCNENDYVKSYVKQLQNKVIVDAQLNSNWNIFLKNICLKSIMIYSKTNIYEVFTNIMAKLKQLKQQNLSQLVRDFLNESMFEQRNIICIFLMDHDNIESQYKAYLLYDLLSNDTNEVVDTTDQIRILNSLTWNMKKMFKTAMKHTIDYTNKMTNVDNISIPFEQHICLMNTDQSVKDKAMVKLKEIKSKSEDSGGKARQYLEGLLKIPFGSYKREPVLCHVNKMKEHYKELAILSNVEYENKSGFEIIDYVRNISQELANTSSKLSYIAEEITKYNRKIVIQNISRMNEFLKIRNIKHRITQSGKSITKIKESIVNILSVCDQQIITELYSYFGVQPQKEHIIMNLCKKITLQWNSINNAIVNNRRLLDKAVHGHDEAKKSLERIIGQWMNGDLTGYCFGFEGPPGVGKTSLAKKGLANTLTDENGVSRPFRFIAIGGSSNGSTLEGHNYTYVGSIWGRIVDILMECKCMNPIIFIDELDKVSQTEHGKEIIGILTHLVDPTQNDDFQDKYFNGISIDLSKVLFVFSYNDVSLIDRILLDRIHRIKFNNLNEDEKLTIAEKYILPEIYEKIGLNSNIVMITKETIQHIINHYTCESGVRKLKEILFEILSEVNIELFQNEISYPLTIDTKSLKSKYLKLKRENKPTMISTESKVGLVNGLWANTLGLGGVLPIQVKYFPSTTYLELKLTGMQGDVMKESMNVSKTVAVNLTPSSVQTNLKTKSKKTLLQGIHVHCPEGAVPKDGPSAGGAITTCIYSLLNDKKIKKDVAMTGEITLEGNITAIGGLEHKIIGGLRAGVKLFLYPKENQEDFLKVVEKHTWIESKASFISVETIEEIFKHVFV